MGPLRWLEPWSVPLALINGAGLGLTPILLPLAVEHEGAGQVGLVMGAYNLGALAAPAAGAVADRWRSHRLLALLSAVGSAVALWLFPLTNAGIQLLLALLDGACVAAAMTVANLLIVERTATQEWNLRLGWLETVLSLGQGGALLLAGRLSGLDVRTGLGVAALVPAAAIPLLAVLVPTPAGAAPSAARHRLANVGHAGEWGAGSPSRHHHRLTLESLGRALGLLRGRFGWMLLSWAPAYAGSAIVFSLYPVLFKVAFHVAPGVSSLAFAVIVFASLPLYPFAGRMGQRRGPSAALVAGLVMRLVVLVALTALAVHPAVPAAAPLAAFSGLAFGWAFLSVASPGLTGELVPQAEGEAQGVLNASSGIAGLVGAVAGGFLAARLGYPAALALGAAGVALGLAVSLLGLGLAGRSRPVRAHA